MSLRSFPRSEKLGSLKYQLTGVRSALLGRSIRNLILGWVSDFFARMLCPYIPYIRAIAHQLTGARSAFGATAAEE